MVLGGVGAVLMPAPVGVGAGEKNDTGLRPGPGVLLDLKLRRGVQWRGWRWRVRAASHRHYRELGGLAWLGRTALVLKSGLAV